MRFSSGAGAVGGFFLALSSLQGCAAGDHVGEVLARHHAHHVHKHDKRNGTTTASSNATTTATSAGTTVVYFQSTYPASASTATVIVTPSVVAASMLGPAVHSPATQYIALPTQALPQLTAQQNTTQIINNDLALDFPVWTNGSGSITYTQAYSSKLKSLSTTPSYSRDSGRGGTVAGITMFVFADTQSYTAPSGPNGGGKYTGGVSNSYAYDRGMMAAKGKPPVIGEGIGAYASSNGFLRGFVPWTVGEAAYNKENMATSRWAIWPASSFITLTPTTSLQYAPIIFANNTGGGAGGSYTSTGVTLCEISAPTSGGGPVCDRIAPRLFPMGTEWGVIGGVRSYGPSGQSGGNVYIFGKTSTGLMLGRVAAANVATLSAYEYYYPSSGSWAHTPPSASSIHNFYNGSFSAVDVFYSPRHLTFIMVYMNNYIDNTIYWRYLRASTPILPTYAGGNNTDIAQYLTMYKWSGQGTLVVTHPRTSFSYDGGATLGYFGVNDISRGGNKMLLSWTEPNGYAANGNLTGYYLGTAVVTFN